MVVADVQFVVIVLFRLVCAIIVCGAGWARRGVTRVLRVVRLVRIFRVVKVGAQYSKMRIIANVFSDTVEILWMLVLLVALAGAVLNLHVCGGPMRVVSRACEP